NGVRALLRQLEVELLVAEAVRVALDQHVALGIRLEKFRQLVDASLRARPRAGLAGIEEHADREHQAAVGLLRPEARQLLRERRALGLLRRAGLRLGFAHARLGGEPDLVGLEAPRVGPGAGGRELTVALLQLPSPSE